MDPIDKFRAYIKQQGLRRTPERETIIEEIFSTHDHFDVDELFLRLRNKRKRVSKASLYRTIPLLIESGLVREVFFENGHLHYEQIYGHRHHCHLRCTSCGKIIEFADDEAVKIEERISKKYGFVIAAHRFELLGYCPRCAKSHGVLQDRGPSQKGNGKRE